MFLLEQLSAAVITVTIIIIAWDIFWRGIALWKSARHEQMYWFIALLLLNTIGILPLVYLLLFQKKTTRKKR